jgi:hypothetical protein
MTAKYRVGQTLELVHKGELCKARIVDAIRPAHKKNSTLYRIEMWPADGSIVIEFRETGHLTAWLEASRKAA